MALGFRFLAFQWTHSLLSTMSAAKVKPTQIARTTSSWHDLYILKRKNLGKLRLQPRQFTYNKDHTNHQSHLIPYSAMLHWQMPTMSHAIENFPHCQNPERFVANLRGCVVEWHPWVNWWTYRNTHLHEINKDYKIDMKYFEATVILVA